jgi:hypothetical protein
MGQSAATSTIKLSASDKRKLTTWPPNSMASGSPKGALRTNFKIIPGRSPNAIKRWSTARSGLSEASFPN